MVSKETIDQFKHKVESAHNIAIVPHLNPDGDAMGSSLGLYHILKNLGKEVNVIIPSAFPKFLSWMEFSDNAINFEKQQEKTISTLDNIDLIIYVDFNCYKRTGDMENLLSSFQKSSIMIDHHPYPDPIADVMISVTEASSTCELVCNVIKQSGWMQHINVYAAECLYAGIMTDTGSLSYNSSNPDTYRTVADLLDVGIDKDKVHQLLFNSNSASRMKLLGYVLSEKMQLMTDYEVSVFCLTKAELDKYSFEQGDTEGFVNYPLGINGINISAFFMEKDGQVKCSFRSKGDFPVNQFSCQFFNGGGHRNAAGGTSDYDMEGTLEVFKREFPKFYKNFVNQ